MTTQWSLYINMIYPAIFFEVNENVRISNGLSSKCVSKYSRGEKSSLAHIMVCCWAIPDTMMNKHNNPPPLDKMAATLQTIFSDAFSWIDFFSLITISLKIVPKGPIHNDPTLVQIMAWYRIGDKPLYLNQWWHNSLKHICVTRPQWVNAFLTASQSLNECLIHRWFQQLSPVAKPLSEPMLHS